MTHRTIRSGIERVAMAMAFTLALGVGIASHGQLPDDLRSASQLTQSQRGQIQTYVTEQLDVLRGDDRRRASDARRRLTSAIDPRGASRTFRLTFAETATPELTQLIDDEGAPISARLTALHLLGQMATDVSATALQAPLRADADAIRYAAANAIEQMFNRIRTEGGVFSNVRQRELEVARWLRTAITEESDHLPLHAQIAALGASSNPSDAVLSMSEALQAQFTEAITDGAGGRVVRYREGLQLALKRYVEGLALPNVAELEQALVRTSVMAIHLALSRGPLVDERRFEQYADLVSTAENVLSVVSGEDESVTVVGAAFANQDVTGARAALHQRWLASDGPIYTKRNWQFRPGDLDQENLFGG